jgi:hypothetical protein
VEDMPFQLESRLDLIAKKKSIQDCTSKGNNPRRKNYFREGEFFFSDSNIQNISTGLEIWLRGETLAWHVRGPAFNLQHHTHTHTHTTHFLKKNIQILQFKARLTSPPTPPKKKS